MKKQVSSLQNWCYCIYDLIEEGLENNKKMLVMIAGASSSGKSFASEKLKDFLKQKGLNSLTISTDSYNRGVSGIIVNKVNKNFFDNKLQNLEAIKEITKNIIIDTDFGDKFNYLDLLKIKKECENLIPKNKMNRFLSALKTEFDKINFDEPSVYNLQELAKDIKTLTNNKQIDVKEYSKVCSERLQSTKIADGKNFDVIIIEGIYALNENLLNNLQNKALIKTFVEGDEKTLFLRRVLRDAKNTSADNIFTIKNYFDFVYPSYKNLILPTKNLANLVFKNDMTFEELRQGQIISKQEKVKIFNKKIIDHLKTSADKISTIFEKDIYLENKDKIEINNILRLRTISENGKSYKLSSLVHKGAIKTRMDGKIIRPINILIKEGQFEKIYSSQKEFLDTLKKAGFVVSKTITKKRTRLIVDNKKYTIDDIKNSGTFVEYNTDNNSSLVNRIKKCGIKCNSFYEEIHNENLPERNLVK